jgi:hypothetical protein
MFAGKHDNFVTRALSAPGLWMQKITTREPTLDMLEIAIISIKCALRDDFPEFKEYYDSEGWITKSEDDPVESSDAFDESGEKAEDAVCESESCDASCDKDSE